ncbi:MAG: ThiF family adenylyltransferase [Myxococcaceae bacterium]|nr:ThiF family adenylyltransferase [Myxococcaceae bacterium]
MALSDPQVQRYSRQILLKEVGGRGQLRLLGAPFEVAGRGPELDVAVAYLAASGTPVRSPHAHGGFLAGVTLAEFAPDADTPGPVAGWLGPIDELSAAPVDLHRVGVGQGVVVSVRSGVPAPPSPSLRPQVRPDEGLSPQQATPSRPGERPFNGRPQSSERASPGVSPGPAAAQSLNPARTAAPSSLGSPGAAVAEGLKADEGAASTIHGLRPGDVAEPVSVGALAALLAQRVVLGLEPADVAVTRFSGGRWVREP